MQTVEIKLNKDQVCDYIIRYLVKDIIPEDYDKYRVKCDVDQNYNTVKFTIIKTEKIAEFTGELIEEFDSGIIKTLLNILINDDYALVSLNLNVEYMDKTSRMLEFTGVNVTLKLNNEKETFVDQKRLEKRY